MTTPFVCDPSAPCRWRVWAALALAAVLTGCATGPTRDPRDPIEPFNRGVSEFNDAVDKAVLKPVATVYADVTPDPVRTAVGNFFGNLRDVWTAVNATLQLRGEDAATSVMRVSVNTTFGFWGLLDLASELRLYRVNADFGQTLGYWGVPPGPYLVLPLLGPSTLRDTVGMGVEASGDLVQGISDVPTRNTLYTLRAVETRAGLLRAGAVLDEAALDKYSFTREVFLKRRQSAIDAQRNRDED
jgi:phospholipid-binding lipoprotein MlaA